MRFPAPKNVAVDDLISIYDGIIDKVDDKLRAKNLGSPPPPVFVPEGLQGIVRKNENGDPYPPPDLTECCDLTIGKLFSYFQNITNNVSYEASRTKCLVMIGEKELKVVTSGLKIYYREELGKPAAAAMDYVVVDQRYVKVDEAVLQLKVLHETLSSRYDQLKRTCNNISREQTRRREELERILHESNGGKEPPKPPRNSFRSSPRSFRE